MAVALNIDPSRIIVQDVLSDGIVYADDYLGVKVFFYLTEPCVQNSMSQTNIYKPTTTPVDYYERDRVQELFSSSSSSNAAVNGSNPDLDALVNLIKQMYGDIDTILYRGYITGKINSAQGLDVIDPSQNTTVPIYTPPKDPWIKKYYWIFILIGVLVLVLIGYLIWKCTRPATYTSANIEERTMSGASSRTMTGTDVRAVFQSGDIDTDHPRPASLASVQLVSSPLSPNVPEGWSKMFEEKSGHYYYYNTKTGESRWDLPQHPA